MKGHPQSNNDIMRNIGVWGLMMRMMRMKKRTAVMTVVVLGFAAAVMAVMGVHRLRERRVFHLLIKDKDRQIFSLQLLLQKEMQSTKESKRKNQDLNTKLYSLRNEKMELHNKLLEMRSTISSLKDEMRTLELTLDEKQKEVKHKESEIKDLRGNLGIPLKLWSVSTDDPSNPEVNLTNKVNVVRKDGSQVGLSTERSLVFARSAINGQKARSEEETRAMNREKNSQQSEVDGTAIVKPYTKVQKASGEDQNGERHLGEVESSEEHETEDTRVNYKDGANVDHGASNKRMEENANKRKGKADNWRTTADDHGVSKDRRTSEEDGVILSNRGRRFIISASESQRNKSQLRSLGLITSNGTSSKENGTSITYELQGPGGSKSGTDEQIDLVHKEKKEGEKGNSSQQKANRVEISADTKQVKSEISKVGSGGEVDRAIDNEPEKRSTDEDSNSDADKIDEDDADEDIDDEDIHGSNANGHGSEADQDYKEDMEE